MGHHEVESKRERRIRLTFQIAARRREEHLAKEHPNGAVDCACELANTYFAKRSAYECGCRKRRPGRPRVAAGMCCIGERERIYEWRLEARLMLDAVRAGRGSDGEPEERSWPRGGAKGPKVFVVEVRSPGGEWSEHRRYRTEAGRDAALRAFRLSTPTVQGVPRREWRGR